jgi:membrane-bound lytic murein transglycosylase B
MIKKFLKTGILGLAAVVINIAWSAPATPVQALTVNEFIDKMVTVDHFNRYELIRLFENTEYIPEVIDRINKPFEEKPWDFYKNFFITPDRVEGGVQYWHQHANTLAKAAQQYGVSPAVIVAIIGIETKYGQESGKFKELGTLATLSFHYPKRAVFFQSQLENYLIFSREYHLSPADLTGSYAGALGIPQFMPSNYRQYAVSFSGKNSVNLLNNHDDAIDSIANYLQKAGWKPHQPVAVPAQVTGAVKPWLISADAKPVYRLKTLSKFGVHPSESFSPARKSALIAMHNTGSQEYWLTFGNFYAIMAYNPRTTYAMAIYQLSLAIQKKYEQGTAQTRPAITASR